MTESQPSAPLGAIDDGVEDAVVDLRVGHQLETTLERAAVADRRPCARAGLTVSPRLSDDPLVAVGADLDAEATAEDLAQPAEDVGDPADDGLDLLVRPGHDLTVEAETGHDEEDLLVVVDLGSAVVGAVAAARFDRACRTLARARRRCVGRCRRAVRRRPSRASRRAGPRLRASRLPVPPGSSPRATSVPTSAEATARTVPSPPSEATTSEPARTASRPCFSPVSSAVVSIHDGSSQPCWAAALATSSLAASRSSTFTGL